MTNYIQPEATASDEFVSIEPSTSNQASAIELKNSQPVVQRMTADTVFTAEQMQQSTSWDWQTVTANTVGDVKSLAKLLDLDTQTLTSLVAENSFKLRVPLPFVSRMRRGDISDPLLLQVLPLKQEQHDFPGNSTDPLNEQQYNVCPGLVHKYLSLIHI